MASIAKIHDITGGDSWAVVVLTLTMKPKAKDGQPGEAFQQTVCEAGSFEDGLLKDLGLSTDG